MIKRGARTYILVGIGINANNTIEDLPEEVRSIATTLHDEVGHDVNTDRLVRELRSGLRNALSSGGVDRHTVHSARKHLYGVDRPAEATIPEGKSVRGVLKGLDDAGCPIIQTAEGMFHAPVTCEVSTQPSDRLRGTRHRRTRCAMRAICPCRVSRRTLVGSGGSSRLPWACRVLRAAQSRRVIDELRSRGRLNDSRTASLGEHPEGAVRTNAVRRVRWRAA